MRTILHSDLNNFYASVECVDTPNLKNVPMAVCGDPEARHGIVLAKNMPAKRIGIKTGEAIWQAKEKCPDLVITVPHFERYIRFSKLMRKIYADYTDYIEPFGLDEAWLDVSGHRMSGAEIADEIRFRAKEELGLTASVGVSFNKIFAKLGSDLRKPDATTVIRPDNYRQIVWPLPAGDLLYIGPATRRKLCERNIFTIGEVARCDPEMLKRLFGKNGEMLWSFAVGKDFTPVRAVDEDDAVKSVGNGVTAPFDLSNDTEVHSVLLILAESVAERLRAQGFAGKTLMLTVRGSSLRVSVFHRKLEEATALSSVIEKTAFAIFHERYRWPEPVRSISICLTDLSIPFENKQMCMFGDGIREKQYALENTVSLLRGRFGHYALTRASLLDNRVVEGMNPREEHNIHPMSWRR